MDKTHLSIATITWARDEQEENLLRQSLQQLATFEIPVYITDGGSNPGFLCFLQTIPNFYLLKANAKGVWAQVKNSLFQAYQSGSPFILYTEPDKHDFFSYFLPQMLSAVSIAENSGVALASRSDAGFSTFPAFQRMTETTINNCCTETIGKPFDYTYGPFLLNRQLVPYLDLVKEDIGWGWRPYIFGIAHRLGYTIESYIGDFSCPIEQRKDNQSERLYRMRQLNQNIQGILLAANANLNDAS